jgi:hypothetical protein
MAALSSSDPLYIYAEEELKEDSSGGSNKCIFA